MRFLIPLSAFVFVWSAALAAPLNEELSLKENAEMLDALTRSPETFNTVRILENGQNSWPAREQLIRESKSFVFITVPFWYYDKTGRTILQELESKRNSVDGFELKVIQGWISPFLSGGGRTTKSVLKNISDQYLGWNSPLWLRRFSFNIFRGHVHDKFLIVDGQKMILGGMNISDHDLGGGINANGTHDVDLLIEGPAVQKATEMFLKINQLGHYLSSSAPFPPFKEQEIEAFQKFFYDNIEDHDFTTVTKSSNPKPPFVDINRVHIPIRSLLASRKYFPDVTEGKTSVRLIYDNPLIDRDVDTKKHYSKLFRTVEFISKKAKSSIWLSLPYLTIDREAMQLLVESAKRLDVRIVTNSVASTDMPLKLYRAQASHYEELVNAGIKLYEWRGHKELKRSARDCVVTNWPGDLLHSKVILFDGVVSLVGSHNLNNRSKNLNNEVMALINDSEFSRLLSPFFADKWAKKSNLIECRGIRRSIGMVDQLDPVAIKALYNKYDITKPIWNYPFGGF